MKNNKCRPGMDCSKVGKQKVKQSGTRYQKKARKAQGRAKDAYAASQPVFVPMAKFRKNGGSIRPDSLLSKISG